jgi:hypothetical protein
LKGSRSAIDTTNYFKRGYWDRYLDSCRELCRELQVRLRDLDRAFWAAAGLATPVS